MAAEVSGLDCGAGNGKHPEEGHRKAAAGAAKRASKKDELPGSRAVPSGGGYTLGEQGERVNDCISGSYSLAVWPQGRKSTFLRPCPHSL